MNVKRPLRKKSLIILALLAICGGGYLWWHSQAAPETAPGAGKPAGQKEKRDAGRPLPPVQAATARNENVAQFLNGLGTVTAASTVTLRSRVDGQLMALHFQEGQQVKAGQLLAEIDPRPYQVALTQAQGQLAKDQATLANARRDLARYEKLAKTNLVSRQELEGQRALVNETLGILKADEGNVASAQLNLTYSRITAPIDGRVGLRRVDVGNYISSGDTDGLVVITQTQPIDVVFSVAENSISQLLQAQKSGQPLPVEAWDRNNSQLIAQGTLLSLDNQIDATTGTLKLKARFRNQDETLFPNQFVNVRLKVSTLQNAIVIPPAALQMSSEGHFVWVVNNENKVSKKSVTAGGQESRRVVIAAGLNAGERVVTDGLDRLTEGATVEVVAPQNRENQPASAVPSDSGERP